MTWPYVRHALAIGIGLGLTIAIKTVAIKLAGWSFYSAYYRKRPAASSVMSVVLECWSLGQSVGTVTLRFVKLILVTAMYVGRIDQPMLAPGVGYIGPMNLDSDPVAFKVDLLGHEAVRIHFGQLCLPAHTRLTGLSVFMQHRHPFIERLGLLYLIKLYNGKGFGTQAGAYWRILFVLALMPWMRNHRVHTSGGILLDNQEDDGKDGAASLREQIQVEMERRGTSGGADDIVSTKLELDLTRRAYKRLDKRNKEMLTSNQKLQNALTDTLKKLKEVNAERRELKRHLNSSESHTSPESYGSEDGEVDV